MKIKILTLNIHKGFSFGNRRHTLEELKSAISGLNLNLVCLQEVVGKHSVFAKQAQFEFLADQIWSHHAYGRNAIYSKGHHGNAILSHFPFDFHENVDISNHRLERRGILHGKVSDPEWGERSLHVMTVHLDLTAWGRMRQVERLCKLVSEKVPMDEPVILAGDFNDWSGEVSLLLKKRIGLSEAHSLKNGAHAKTYPAAFPMLPLDRIYYRGLKLEDAGRLAGAPWDGLSDHLALWAEFSVPFSNLSHKT
jgi:endonuclease/exonuclease/phosphatase family metal-dependent hydrolase